MTPETEKATKLDILRSNLAASRKVALRLSTSMRRIEGIFPLSSASMDALEEDDEERIDAFLFRFNSLVGMVQDQLTRSVLEVEEEDVTDASRRDKRNLMEKLGAFRPEYEFGVIAELRNRLSHVYPDDPQKQADILNAVSDKAAALVQTFNDVLAYVHQKHFSETEDFDLVGIVSHRSETGDDADSPERRLDLARQIIDTARKRGDAVEDSLVDALAIYCDSSSLTSMLKEIQTTDRSIKDLADDIGVRLPGYDT